MRLVFIWVFAVLLFAACDNTTANKSDADTAVDQTVVTDEDQTDPTDQSDPTDQTDDVSTDDIVTDNPVTDDTVDENERPDGDTIGATCATIEECSVGMFCKKADGDCTGTGVCDIKPDDCTSDKVYVCGCDGQTYTNACWANNSGLNVLAADVCPTPTACSGDGINGGCADPATYCRPTGNVCGGDGFCEIIPLECPDWDYPVCACDDKTYPSRCHAEMQKQGILHDKECGSMSPCSTNDQCSATEFCAKPLGTCDTTAMGKCDNRPTDCEMTRAVAPQCGCDDYTYSNQCWAAAAGAVIAHDGECDGDVMCWSKDDCGENEFCEKKTGVCDMGFGVCRPVPPDCPDGEEPDVCGCDLRTYTDACQADMAGASVKHEGPCTGPDDSQVRYFYADNAETPDGYLRIVVSPTDIREFWTTDTFIEQFNGESSVTITVTFYAPGDFVPPDYAVLQYTLSLPATLPMGVGFGYEGAYLKWYDGNSGVEMGEMAGTVITYEYVRLDAGNEVSTLIVSGLNLSVE
ncbi:MAG TPA: Kazal-type serine protease inhibitor domain-containing protein [bacterium]|nr:Kazal-type serine protease inhibitor domain-containing protein [bacterium]